MDRIVPDAAAVYIEKAIEHVYSYGPLAQQTVVLVPDFVNTQVEQLAESTGQDLETLKYTLGMFLCYPLGLIMVMLPYGKVKHLFSFLLGAFLLQFTIGVQWIHQLITSVVVYLMLIILPPGMSKTLIPIFTMFYCTIGHLHRQYINYLGWDLDFTGSQMVITMKLYALAYNIYDGHLLKIGKPDRASKKCANLAVDGVPGFLEYLGYCFNFSTVLAGPAFEYKIYEAACNGSNLYNKDGKPLGKKPSNVWATLKPFIISLFCMGMFVVGSAKVPLLDPTDPQNNPPVIITEEFLANPWYYRYGYTWVALLMIRQKYYFAWKNAEGASNIWYAGFEGFDAEGNALGWENSNNVDALTFETADNLKTLTAAWNKKTANWLGKYVYMRTGGSLVATYGLSAFWHGFYPGYYFFFLSVPLLTFCERTARKKITPLFDGSILYNLVCRVVTTVFVNYTVIPFQLLAFDWALVAWKSNYFFGHICSLAFFLIVGRMKTPKKKEA
jgi:hypothetical protein